MSNAAPPKIVAEVRAAVEFLANYHALDANERDAIATLHRLLDMLECGKEYWAAGDLPLLQSSVELDDNRDDVLFIDAYGEAVGPHPLRCFLIPLPDDGDATERLP